MECPRCHDTDIAEMRDYLPRIRFYFRCMNTNCNHEWMSRYHFDWQRQTQGMTDKEFTQFLYNINGEKK